MAGETCRQGGGLDMTFNEIMEGIEAGLTGDPIRDTEYLKGKAVEYQNHEAAEEILPGIGKLMFELLPEEQREGVVQSLREDSLKRRMVLDEVRHLMEAKRTEDALAMMEGLISGVEEMRTLIHHDEENVHFCFRNRFEEVLYHRLENPEGEVMQAPEEFCDAYFTYGRLLATFQRTEEAATAYRKASAFNPVAVEPLLELAEIYKAKRNYQDYLDVLGKSLKRCIRPEDIARCYRYLGFYYSEHHNYELAIALYFTSLKFEKDNFDAQIGLHYISEGTYSKISEPDEARVRELFADKGIPYGADDVVLDAALTAARLAASEGEYDEAREYFGMVYTLNQDEQVKEWIEQLPSA